MLLCPNSVAKPRYGPLHRSINATNQESLSKLVEIFQPPAVYHVTSPFREMGQSKSRLLEIAAGSRSKLPQGIRQPLAEQAGSRKFSAGFFSPHFVFFVLAGGRSASSSQQTGPCSRFVLFDQTPNGPRRQRSTSRLVTVKLYQAQTTNRRRQM